MSSSAESHLHTASNKATSYCLRWNTFTTHLAKGLSSLLEDSEFTDVVVACDGQFLKAHRVLLSLCSPFFKRLFKANEVSKNGSTVVILNNIRFTDLECIIQFVYHGQVNVQQADLNSFLKTAELLQIEGLAQGQGEEGIQGSEEPVDDVVPPSLPILQPAPTTQRLHTTLSTNANFTNTSPILRQMFRSETREAQNQKRIKLSTETPTSRLQSILTGQSYIAAQPSPNAVENSCVTDSTDSSQLSGHPFEGSIKGDEEEMFMGPDIFEVPAEENSVEFVEEHHGYSHSELYQDSDEQDLVVGDRGESHEFKKNFTGETIPQGISVGSSNNRKVLEEMEKEVRTKHEGEMNYQKFQSNSEEVVEDSNVVGLLHKKRTNHQGELERLLFADTRTKTWSSNNDDGVEKNILENIVQESLTYHTELVQTNIPGAVVLESDEEMKAQCPYCLKFYKNSLDRSSLKVHKSVYHRNEAIGTFII